MHSMNFLYGPLPLVFLGDLILAVLAGGAIGLITWRRRPEAARGHLLSLMLRWMGGFFGLFVLREVVGVIYWVWNF